MKKIFLYSTLLVIASLASCSGGKKTVEDDPNTDIIENFRISGTIEGADNISLHLEAMSPQGTITVAECTTDADGNFDMLNNIPDMGIYQLRLGDDQESVLTLPLVPQDNVELKAAFATFQSAPDFSGTEWSESLNKYYGLFSQFIEKQKNLASQQGKVPDEELMQKYLDLRKPIDAFCLKSVEANPGNPANILLTSFLTPNMGFKDWDPTYLTTLKKMSAAYMSRYKKSPIAQKMAEQVSQIEIGYEQFKVANSGNQMAPEIALNNPEGKQITLSSLRGKYVLIDFWASWCGPCRKENPNVVKLYNTYKDKGFTILSVSLDDNVTNWKEAIKADGLVWPNHVSDLLGWKSKMVQLYGFQGIPYTVLVDKEGKIIETGLRGESLEQKLKELIKN